MKSKIFNRKYLTALLAVAAMAGSCTREEQITGPIAPEDGKTMTLRIAVPRTPQPATRALDEPGEYTVDEITVLAFDADDQTYYGRYPGFVTDGPAQTGSAGGATMTFTTTLPHGEFDLMVIANGNSILNAVSPTLVMGADQSDVVEALKMSMGTTGWDVDPSPVLLPMWGYKEDVDVPDDFTDPDNTLNSTIGLTRMVARVDVGMHADLVAADNFELKSVRVYNYAEQGRLVPDLDGAFDWNAVTATTLAALAVPTLPAGYTKADPATEFTDYTLAPGETSLVRSIYLFEAPAGVDMEDDPTGWVGNTCLVIGGNYDGGGTTYYRVDFANDLDANLADAVYNWQYLPVMRNHFYDVQLKRVREVGYPTPDDALRGSARLTAEVLDWNASAVNTIFDGQYFLNVDSDRIEFSLPGVHSAQINAETNYDIDDRGFPRGLKLLTPLVAPWLTVAGGNDSEMSRVLTLTAEMNTTTSTRNATLSLVAGNMTKTITVSQPPIPKNIAAPGVIGYVEGTNELTLRGSADFRGTPVETAAEAMFPGEGLHPERVFVAYFKWGSLIALDSHTTPFTPASAIVWAPTGYAGTTGAPAALAAARTIGSYAAIPYGNDGTSWPATDAAAGKGDPCTLMTEGGVNWRVPSTNPWYDEGGNPFQTNASSWSAKTNGARWVATGLPVAGGVGGNGTSEDWSMFLSGAGARNGTGILTWNSGSTGVYWSSWMNTNATSTLRINTSSGASVQQSANDFYAYAIRCVPEPQAAP